jgi:hypothetical protein
LSLVQAWLRAELRTPEAPDMSHVAFTSRRLHDRLGLHRKMAFSISLLVCERAAKVGSTNVRRDLRDVSGEAVVN